MTFDEALYYVTDHGGTARLDTPTTFTEFYFTKEGFFQVSWNTGLTKEDILSEDWKVFGK